MSLSETQAILHNQKVVRRGQLKVKLTRFSTFLYKVDTSEGIISLQTRLDTVVLIYNEFDSVQSEIEYLTDPSNAQSEQQERLYFEDTYYAAKFYH